MVEQFACERKNISLDCGSRILNCKELSDFPIKEKKIKPGSWFEAIFFWMRPSPNKTAKKAKDRSKEGPINATVGKSGAYFLGFKTKRKMRKIKYILAKLKTNQ